MRKTIFCLIPVLFILMACTCSLPSILPPQPTSKASVPPSDAGIQSTGFVIVRLVPNQGDLRTQLSAEVQKAAEQGRKPFVEWDAEW